MFSRRPQGRRPDVPAPTGQRLDLVRKGTHHTETFLPKCPVGRWAKWSAPLSDRKLVSSVVDGGWLGGPSGDGATPVGYGRAPSSRHRETYLWRSVGVVPVAPGRGSRCGNRGPTYVCDWSWVVRRTRLSDSTRPLVSSLLLRRVVSRMRLQGLDPRHGSARRDAESLGVLLDGPSKIPAG